MTISSGAECCSYDDQDQLCRDSVLLHFDVGHGCQPVYLSIFNVFSVILHIIYNVSTEACLISTYNVSCLCCYLSTLPIYYCIHYLSPCIIVDISACTGVRCRIYVLITAVEYLRRYSDDCRDREITPPMIHRFAPIREVVCVHSTVFL